MAEGVPRGEPAAPDLPDWYEVVEGPTLRQGDILFGCPVLRVPGDLAWPPAPGVKHAVEAVVADLVVMTQSCDLDNDKVQDVLLAQVVSWDDVVKEEVARGNGVVKSRNFRRALIAGNVPGQALLHKCDRPPGLPWSVVSFPRLVTVPKDFLARFAADRGPRLRLRSPYREHLAQAFARFFMRVGLPHDAKAFEVEGDVPA
jgi:hypothetical protein